MVPQPGGRYPTFFHAVGHCPRAVEFHHRWKQNSAAFLVMG